jgi:methionyl-tRNA synthetase
MLRRRWLRNVKLLRRLPFPKQLKHPLKKFYITTPIYYVNTAPHVGNSTTTLICDAVNRYHQLRGEDSYLLTGTDEHAQKVADAALKEGMTPIDFVDKISQRFVDTWKFLGVRYDRFIRTTDPDHKKVVAEVFDRLKSTGDVYLGTYEGWYSIADETFFRDSEVADGRAKDTGAPVERVTQENYYFRLSAYGDKLQKYITDHPTFLLPDTRRNEVIAFIKDGLRDVPISRRTTGWGIPVPNDSEQIIYVWFDALINYLTATGWPSNPEFDTLWPADVHLVGKEIYTRFHATLWPAMLMGLGLPLPKHVIGHGWWLVDGEKGSKSKGNIPTPREAVEYLTARCPVREDIAVDALRYYLMRDIAFSGDAEFGCAHLVARYNGELANDLGNLLNRSLNMLRQYNDSVIPDCAARTAGSSVAQLAKDTGTAIDVAMEECNTGAALDAIVKFVTANNKAIDTAAPWKRAKEGDLDTVKDALYVALEACRIVSIYLSPFMPTATKEIRTQLGLTTEPTWQDASIWGLLPAGQSTPTATPLFPRIDTRGKLQEPVTGKLSTQGAATNKPIVSEKKPVTENEKITIGDFARIELKVAKILTAEPVEGAKKLLRLTIDIGEAEPRQLVAGIAGSYNPADLPGRLIVVVANLAPAKIRGIESNGMLLAASDDVTGKAILLTPESSDLAPGSKVR